MESIKQGQQPLWDDSKRGLLLNYSKSQTLKLQKRGLKEETPISGLLDHTKFDIFVIRDAYCTLLDELSAIDNGSFDKMKQVSAETLSNHIVSGLNNGKGLPNNFSTGPHVKQVLSSIMIGALVQPSMIYLSRQCNQDYLDSWSRIPCPVCGNHPSIVVKEGSGVRRFMCTFCSSKYRMDPLICPSCRETDASNFDFMLVGNNREYEIASCRQCKRYYKIINLSRLKESIPEGTEGLFTEFLDNIAEDEDLFRIDETLR